MTPLQPSSRTHTATQPTPEAAPGRAAPGTSHDAAASDALLPELERDGFLRRLLRDLSGVLEETVGLDEASGFIAVVGQRMGEWMDAQYRERLGVPRLGVEDVARVLVDLKTRIHGGFSIESIDDHRIVLVNTRCPFGEYVHGRPSLCMMTSNVFGVITAENLGYARIDLERTIARGDSGCRVVVHLTTASASYVDPTGLLSREYFATR